MQITLEWLAGWAALLALSVLATEGVHFATLDVDPGATLITLALCCSWLAVLLMPVTRGGKTQPKHVLLWAAMTAAGFLALSSTPLYFEQGERSLRLAAGVLMLVWLFSAMQSLIRVYAASHASAMIHFTLIAGACCAAPLYLSVVAEAVSHQTLVVDAIIAASPVSYLAALADYDYLRSTWFYQHTPFGGLRFNYPAAGVMTVGYFITSLVLAGASIHGNQSKLRTLKQ